jgi:hypothetical protein
VSARLASTVGHVALALEPTSVDHTGGSATVLYLAESECKKKADSLVETESEGRVLGRYSIGRTLLEGRGQRYTTGTKPQENLHFMSAKSLSMNVDLDAVFYLT